MELGKEFLIWQLAGSYRLQVEERRAYKFIAVLANWARFASQHDDATSSRGQGRSKVRDVRFHTAGGRRKAPMNL